MWFISKRKVLTLVIAEKDGKVSQFDLLNDELSLSIRRETGEIIFWTDFGTAHSYDPSKIFGITIYRREV